MPEVTDPTFYRSPAAAIAAPPERLAYVAAFDPAGTQRDAMTVVDCEASSPTYGEVVGWTELPTAGNELHHFGWNACSSALCHEGHVHNGSLERRYLIVPGIRSSRTYVLDTKPDPRQPQVTRIIEPDELAAKAGYSRPHTVHCGPGGIFMSNLGGANGSDGPGGVALIDHDTFEVTGAWETDPGDPLGAVETIDGYRTLTIDGYRTLLCRAADLWRGTLTRPGYQGQVYGVVHPSYKGNRNDRSERPLIRHLARTAAAPRRDEPGRQALHGVRTAC